MFNARTARWTARASAVIAAMVVGQTAVAQPIVYTFVGTAYGNFAGTQFSNDAFRLTFTGDLRDVQVFSLRSAGIAAGTATLDISGFATATLTQSLASP